LAQCDFPLAGAFLPFSSNDFGVESHVFAKIEHFHNLEQILLDIGCIREEAGPIRVEGEIECVGMRGDVAGAT
jgi:hypothetical protein